MNKDECNKLSLNFFKSLTKCYDDHHTNDSKVEKHRCIKNVYNKYIQLKTRCVK